MAAQTTEYAATGLLERRIEALKCRQRQAGLRQANRAWLLRSFECRTPPPDLILDSVLEPVDKILWLVLDLHADSGADDGRLPPFAELARRCNISCRGTVSKSLSALRCTRWLTICGSCRRLARRQRGQVYVLHQSPLPIPDTLRLDPGYRDFLERTAGAGRGQRQAVARKVLQTIKQ